MSYSVWPHASWRISYSVSAGIIFIADRLGHRIGALEWGVIQSTQPTGYVTGDFIELYSSWPYLPAFITLLPESQT